MAGDTPKGRTAFFPSRFKTFVKDVANLKRPHSQHQEKGPEPAPATPESTWSIESETTEKPEGKSGVSVQLSISFDEPLDFSCHRCYNSSADFKPSERLLRGLLRRIDHGSYELITRKDPSAPTATKHGGKLKTKRFEMTFQISQRGSAWATRTYRSYQREVITAEAAKEIVLSTHRLIGLFLRRHDPQFVWKDGPIRDELFEGPETSPCQAGGIQPVTCIPRSRFLEDSQTFEAVPGYALEVSFASRSQRHKSPRWHRTIEIESGQTTPLNLAVAEGLLSDITCALEGALQSRRKIIEDRHQRECGFIGPSCHHYGDDATEVNLRIMNNLGPQFNHLERTILSKVAVLYEPESKECVDFVDSLEKSIKDARDAADDTIARLNDLDFRIVELRGRGWKLDEPLIFTLGPSASYSRRSVQAILDRIQSGVADTLRGSAGTVRMTAAKRGHFILDKTLIAREPNADASRWSTPSKSRAKVVDRLKRRIEQDIQMICKDTCSLDNLDDDLSGSDDKSGSVLGEPLASAVAAQIPLPVTPPNEATQTLDNPGQTDHLTPVSTDAQVAGMFSDGTEPMSPLGSETSFRSVRCPQTGIRAFPLIPTRTTSRCGTMEHSEPGSPKHEVEQPVVDDKSTELSIGTAVENPTAKDDEQDGESGDALLQNVDDKLEQDCTTDKGKSTAELADGPDSSEPQGKAASTSIPDADKRRGDPDELSIAPSTPSLVFGGTHSARSSLYASTPKVQGSMSSAEVELLMAQTAPEENFDEGIPIPNEAAEIDAHQKFLKFASVDSPSARVTRYRPAPSPLHQQDLIASDVTPPGSADSTEETGDSTSATERAISEERENRPSLDGAAVTLTSPTFEEAVETPEPSKTEAKEPNSLEIHSSEEIKQEHDSVVQEATLGPDESTIDSHAIQPPVSVDVEVFQVTDTPSGLSQDILTPTVVDCKTDAPPLDGINTPVRHDSPAPSDGFSQTRQDFDFSSPWTVSTPFSEDQQPDQYAILDDAIDGDDGPRDPSTAGITNIAPLSSTTLVRPSFSRGRQSSFGSAGLLGFHYGEQPLIEVGLRRALVMGSSRIPFYKSTGGSYSLSTRRPASSGTELDLARRVSGSSRNELGIVKKRSVGGGEGTGAGGVELMKRSASSNMLQDLILVKEEDEDKGKNKNRGRSASVILFIAGATLASQMIKPVA